MPWWYQRNVRQAYWFTRKNSALSILFNLCQLPISSVSIVLQGSFWIFSVAWITGQASTWSVESFLLQRKESLYFERTSRGLWSQGFEPGKSSCHAVVIAWSSLSEMPRTIRYYHWGSWRHHFKKRKSQSFSSLIYTVRNANGLPNNVFRCPQCDECSLTPWIGGKGFCSHFTHRQRHVTNTGRY